MAFLFSHTLENVDFSVFLTLFRYFSLSFKYVILTGYLHQKPLLKPGHPGLADAKPGAVL